jgi:putative ABC transport system permease protein
MFKNNFKIAVRNILKRKIFSLINIIGLATGMAICLLIVLFMLQIVQRQARNLGQHFGRVGCFLQPF